MNDSTSNDLMIHVERIVRPVRANQSRKLRMRRELLAHLQSALEEELGKTTDEATAIERAKQRLGEPSELTRQLQQSVPWFQRLLAARTPDKFNRWEYSLGTRLGLRTNMTIAHSLLLFAAWAMALFLTWNFSPHIPVTARTAFFVNEIDHPGHAKAVLLTAWVLQMAWMYTGGRYLFAAAVPAQRFRMPVVMAFGFLTLLLQAALMDLIMTQIIGRFPMPGEALESLGAGAILLGVCIPIARAVAVLRRPYDEWLALDLS